MLNEQYVLAAQRDREREIGEARAGQPVALGEGMRGAPGDTHRFGVGREGAPGRAGWAAGRGRAGPVRRHRDE